VTIQLNHIWVRQDGDNWIEYNTKLPKHSQIVPRSLFEIINSRGARYYKYRAFDVTIRGRKRIVHVNNTWTNQYIACLELVGYLMYIPY